MDVFSLARLLSSPTIETERFTDQKSHNSNTILHIPVIIQRTPSGIVMYTAP